MCLIVYLRMVLGGEGGIISIIASSGRTSARFKSLCFLLFFYAAFHSPNNPEHPNQALAESTVTTNTEKPKHIPSFQEQIQSQVFYPVVVYPLVPKSSQNLDPFYCFPLEPYK